MTVLTYKKPSQISNVTAMAFAAKLMGIVNVKHFGAVGDGITDDSVAIQSAINYAATNGGIVFFPAGIYLIGSQIYTPDDLATTNPKMPALMFFGAGSSKSGRGTDAIGGTILDMRFSGTYGKILSLGLGNLEIKYISFVDKGTDNTPFIYSTYTTLHIHNNSFQGNKAGALADQDAIVLGGTLGIEGPRGADNGFQGYGTVIENNHFHRIRRAVYGRVYFNGNVIQNNTLWNTCGSNLPGGAGIEIDGDPLGTQGQSSVGNVIIGNLIEATNYVYPIKLRRSEKNTFIGNNFYDNTGTTVSFYYFEQNTARYNTIINGFSTDVIPLINATAIADNTIINSHQGTVSSFSEKVKYLKKVEFSDTDNNGQSPFFNNAAGARFFWSVMADRVGFYLKSPTGVDTYMMYLRDFTGGIYEMALQGTDCRFQSVGKLRLRSKSGSELYLGDETKNNIYILDGVLYNNGIGVATGVDLMQLNGGFSAKVIKTGRYTTALRPLATANVAGSCIFDTTLGKPIWSDGSVWKDATGATV